MAILVTGGAGYIGSHTCVELLNRGEEVIILDDFSNSKPSVLDRIKTISGKEFKFYEVNLLNIIDVDKVFADNDITEVIHFAAFKAVGESVSKPLQYYHNNLTGTFNLCSVMQKYKVKRIVFSSSATVYGMPKTVPITEDFPLSTTNPYGATKLMIEQVLTDLHVADSSWSIAILRYFNPIGAHKSGLIGEDPNGIPNNLMPYIAQVGSGKLPYLNVYGDDYDTVDGTGVRDYIHVVDLSLGHLKAIDLIRTKSGVDCINLGTGNGYSVLQMVAAYEKTIGKKIEYKIAPRRAGDIAECYADPTKAANLLGWKAERGLEEMCEDTLRWQKN